ncbi:hypothetical protein CBOM_05556 [Ceraceosorus bombacis]|uniref:Wax synthase domain-containing protein n=1 Tax=Ceraceosorus bombacis TaxID=401625 RepID=A0A0P1BRP8_9BASI|nr:hypothetical protein CBOM_05556 [Ceraceosorus bombacis]
MVDFLDKASELAADTIGSLFKPKYSKLGFPLLNSDPVLDAARWAGFEVVEYDLPPYPLRTAGIIAIRMMSFMFFTSFVARLLYYHVATKSQVLRYGCVGGLSAVLLAWPIVTGMSGCMMLDFWRPALGFRSSLLVYDIFVIRTRQEIDSWNFARFFCGLWAFPKEEDDIEERTKAEGFKRNARIENAKGYPKVLVEGIIFLLTLYIIPPYEIAKDLPQLKYHLYCDALGVSILMALALFGDGLLKGLGIIFNVEMQDMFESPLSTINIRLFWSHWNRAIASVFHRVIFGGHKNKKVSSNGPTKSQQIAASKRVRELAQAKRKTYDHLSETEAEHSKTDDEEHERRVKKNGLKMTSTKPAQPQAKPAKRSPFLPKAVAAVVTFAASGIFHEHITYSTMGQADGMNFLFFVLNGLATVASTWFRRTYPDINNKIPTIVAVLLLHSFFLAVVPLFCNIFIKTGFFIQMEALKYEILPINFKTRGSFIYIFGK